MWAAKNFSISSPWSESTPATAHERLAKQVLGLVLAARGMEQPGDFAHRRERVWVRRTECLAASFKCLAIQRSASPSLRGLGSRATLLMSAEVARSAAGLREFRALSARARRQSRVHARVEGAHAGALPDGLEDCPLVFRVTRVAVAEIDVGNARPNRLDAVESRTSARRKCSSASCSNEFGAPLPGSPTGTTSGAAARVVPVSKEQRHGRWCKR